MTRLSTALERGEFVVTAEVCPPKGSDCSTFLQKAKALAGHVTAINVTDNQGANMRISPLAAAALLAREGIEPIYQITCRDRNRLAVQSDLLGAAALSIHNVLALTGDHITFGDHKSGKAVFDIDSVQLLQTIRTLSEGKDIAGKPLQGAPIFYAGAAAAPDAEPFELAMLKVEKKLAAGARFLQTQAVFSAENLQRLSLRVRPRAKLIAGILVLKSAGMARFINKNIPGLTIPEEYVSELESSADAVRTGTDIAARLARQCLPYCDGIHIMAMEREDLIPELVATFLPAQHGDNR